MNKRQQTLEFQEKNKIKDAFEPIQLKSKRKYSDN